ncbi:DUF4252 domain-containing protein [Wenzhouxiangella sp. XN79A]|uniref:DUF4252 domain-containing protein n=1 Tax=Wenzhouxiangella sp. XN79A TaxID=2724193 RepID=UPI00144A5379|nr:DUF4252 domain-containing protein [Wenzhouxiangella sp. XN79A]NKI35243.1 DUF4252 domain-containing protein [Wenzhouxiangella sp. XN79A]
MKIITALAILFWLPLAGTAFAQADAPGQVDLEPVKTLFGASPKVNINFGSAMMRGFAEGFRETNGPIADLVGSVSGLRVMVFEDVDGSRASDFVARTTASLAGDGWTPAVEVRDGDDQIDIYMKESTDVIDGIVLMVTEAGNGDAVFINIFGALDPVFIGQTLGGGIDFNDFDLEDLMSIRNGGGAAEDTDN